MKTVNILKKHIIRFMLATILVSTVNMPALDNTSTIAAGTLLFCLGSWCLYNTSPKPLPVPPKDLPTLINELFPEIMKAINTSTTLKYKKSTFIGRFEKPENKSNPIIEALLYAETISNSNHYKLYLKINDHKENKAKYLTFKDENLKNLTIEEFTSKIDAAPWESAEESIKKRVTMLLNNVVDTIKKNAINDFKKVSPESLKKGHPWDYSKVEQESTQGYNIWDPIKITTIITAKTVGRENQYQLTMNISDKNGTFTEAKFTISSVDIKALTVDQLLHVLMEQRPHFPS